MFKYSNELKLKFIKYYLEEHHSYSECCKQFNIKWIKFKDIKIRAFRLSSSLLFKLLVFTKISWTIILSVC